MITVVGLLNTLPEIQDLFFSAAIGGGGGG